MLLTPEALEEFRILWDEDHPGQTITEDRLIELATCVLRSVELVYQPIPKDQIEMFKQFEEGEL